MVRKIIFDTDPGVDDATALLFAHRHPDVEIVGITTIFGNADIETVTRNARYLTRLYGIDAPLARGAGRALAAPPGPAPTHVHGANGLGDVMLDDVDLPELDPRPAHLLISDLTRAHPGEITIVAVGRLTNLAVALAHDPGLAERVAGVVIMGGAFGLGGPNGNVTPAAEANVIGDPDAADQVFGANWPVTAIGLDVTQKIILSRALLPRIAAGGLAGDFVARISDLYMRYHERYGIDGCFVNDSSAIAYIAAPELFSLRKGSVRVVTDGVAVGQTLQRNEAVPYGPGAWDGRPQQAAAVDVEADAVLALLVDTIAAANEGRPRSIA